MNNLTTEQIARVMQLYIGQPVIATEQKEHWHPFDKGEVGLKLIGVIGSRIYIERIAENVEDKFNQTKLFLRPLSAITDEDAIEVAKICHAVYPREGEEFFIERKLNEHNPNGFVLLRKRFTHPEWAEMNDPIIMTFGTYREYIRANKGVEYFSSMSEVFQYLAKRGYALPLYHGPNHPDNGKTAIELGLALDATIHNKK